MKKEIKGTQMGRKEVKLSLLADDLILYIENLKVSIKKLLELINKFSKVAGCEINIQKSVAFLYTNDELSERESKKTIPFKIKSKRIKYLGINLTEKVKDPRSENSKTIIQEMKMIHRNGKISHIHGLEELILLKWPYDPKQSTDLMQPLSKYRLQFFTELEQIILKFTWNHERL